MAEIFGSRELYGGAIKVELPRDFIDASTLREIPDHQEVFLSSTTLTSVIFEINEYQTASSVEVHSNIHRRGSTQIDEDEAASTHHFMDCIDPPDTLDPESITVKSLKTVMGKPSLSRFPAYIQEGTIVSSEIDRNARAALPPEWEQEPPKRTTETRVSQLLVRLKEYETDFCVRVNVPMKEYVEDEKGRKEETDLAKRVVEAIVRSLDVQDFHLLLGG